MANQLIFELLNYLGVEDADKALECDEDVCKDLILSITVCNDAVSKFLKYMRA